MWPRSCERGIPSLANPQFSKSFGPFSEQSPVPSAVPDALSRAIVLNRSIGKPFSSASESRFHRHPHRSNRSARFETDVSLGFACQQPREQSRLNLQNPPVVHSVSEQGMRYESVHSLLVRPQKTFSPARCESNGRADTNKMVRRDHPRIDRADHNRISNQGPELLHQVQSQGWPSESWLMKEADKRIEADAVTDDR